MPTVDNQTDTGYYFFHGTKKNRARAWVDRHGQARINGTFSDICCKVTMSSLDLSSSVSIFSPEGTFEIEGVMKTEIGPDDHLIIKLGGKYLKKRNGVEVQEKSG